MNRDTLRSDTGFPCTRCGACCRVAGRLGHPSYDGVTCIFLDERTDLCTIYETRPLVCHFGATKPDEQSMEEYAKDVAEGCNTLQSLLGLDPAFRVRL